MNADVDVIRLLFAAKNFRTMKAIQVRLARWHTFDWFRLNPLHILNENNFAFVTNRAVSYNAVIDTQSPREQWNSPIHYTLTLGFAYVYSSDKLNGITRAQCK